MSRRGRVVEMLIFLSASALGIYALGRGLNGLFEPGQAVNPLWLAVAGVAVWILFSQMGRVQDRWPHRDQSQQPPVKPRAESEGNR